MTIQPRHGSGRRPATSRPRGVSPVEVVVVLAVLFLLALVVMAALPRQRENARMAGCRKNLMQIGVGLALYEKSEGRLPTVLVLSADPMPSGGPLKAMLEALALPDLAELSDASRPPERRPGEVPAERPVTGFVCRSDPNAVPSERLPAPVSYRATAGDQPDGRNGAFAPGRSVRSRDIEDEDGRSFTAAFSERLLGDGRDGHPSPNNYRRVPGPLDRPGCPTAGPSGWRGDAGSSWAEASWRSTLYNHAITPGAAPSCVADDGASAFLGASSGHTAGVNVLTADGGVRTVVPTVDPNVWKALATTHSDATNATAPSPETRRGPNDRPETRPQAEPPPSPR